jgi:hypothetical protein
VTNAAKAKGDAAEREAAALLSDLLGTIVRRQLGAGRTDASGGDTGDIHLPGCVVQVANYVDMAKALRVKVPDAETQAERAGVPFGVAMLRRRGGGFYVAMTPETFAAIYREVLA